MNRIFKFRAWEETENKMYKCIVGNTDTNDDEFICPLIWIEEMKDWVHSHTCVVMQYTGYKDIKLEAESLLDYSKEDLNFYIDKIREIDNKIFQVRDIIDGK